MTMSWLMSLVLLAAAPSWAGTPRASSELRDSDGQRHPASHAFDGLLHTGWAEGELGDGAGSWLELRLDAVTDVQSVSIWPGNLSGNERTLREYGRPKTVRITLSGAGEEVVVEKALSDPGELGMMRVDIDVEGKARTIRIDVDDTFRGGIYSDMFIAEVAVNFAKGTPSPAVERLKAWLESDAGQRASNKNRDEVIALYERVMGAEFGDRDALTELMERAADGAPFLRRQVNSQVPMGYRVHALVPDEVSVEALLKIKDSNAIPAIDRAAVRTLGATSARFTQLAGVFRAHQDLVGGQRVTVRPWGQTGFAKGALQSFGEPLQIEVDRFGGVWVADVGNHRVQRFGMNGLVEKTWGLGEPGITNTWFHATRPHYAAAHTPSEAEGGFTNPVDLAIVPGKDSDTVAILDAAGRVTILGGGSKVLRAWKIPAEERIIAGVGGEGYLVHTKGKLAVIWGNEGWLFSMEGEELGHFQLKDGVPSGAVGLSNGKLGLIYGRELVMYSVDGFRHGDILNGALGTGFEAWDVTLDERGKLWAVTDAGLLVKFKRPGRIDYQVRLDTAGLSMPRLDVHDDMAFITHKDAILKVDALELHAQQSLEENP